MAVVTNYFDQISPSGNGQFHNTIILSTAATDVVVFNNMSYPCRWRHTIDNDGQWQQITVSFVRHPRDEWPVEHYVCIGYDTFILQYGLPATRCDRPSEDGTFYDIPLKILRVLSLSRCATAAPTPPGPRQYLHLGPGAESVAFYLQIAYQVPSVTYEEVPLAVSMEFQSALPQIDAEEQQEYVVLALDET